MTHSCTVAAVYLTPGDLIRHGCIRQRVVAVGDDTLTLLVGGVLHDVPRPSVVRRVAHAKCAESLAGFTGGDVVAMMTLVDEPHDLQTVWSDIECDDAAAFMEAVTMLTGRVCTNCVDCEDDLMWEGDGRRTHDGASLCGWCYEHRHFTCDRCTDIYPNGDSTVVGDSRICERCIDEHYFFCDECDEYDTDSHDHSEPDESCQCEAPHPRFVFPANGDGLVQNDTRLHVVLPAGTIDPVGIREIHQALVSWLHAAIDDDDLWDVLEEIGPMWQAKRGNFPKRLSAALHRHGGVKMDPHVMSAVGNLAKQHSSSEASWSVEVTRYLNGAPEDFFHEGSCWWTSHSKSRCALKNWGGVGLRSFDESGYVSGRAWVQPLNRDFEPTHDTIGASAYVVYNGYGTFEGYTPARIVAHLTGLTYKKVGLDVDEQYVNNDSGYLVANTATCESTSHIQYGYHLSPHDQSDARYATIQREVVTA